MNSNYDVFRHKRDEVKRLIRRRIKRIEEEKADNSARSIESSSTNSERMFKSVRQLKLSDEPNGLMIKITKMNI